MCVCVCVVWGVCFCVCGVCLVCVWMWCVCVWCVGVCVCVVCVWCVCVVFVVCVCVLCVSVCVHFRTYVLKAQAYKLRKIGRKFRNKLDKLTATSVHIFRSELWRIHQCTILGKSKIIQRGFPLYNGKGRLNRALRLALSGGATFQCETEVYSKRSCSHRHFSIRGKKTMINTGKWGVKCRLLCVEKRHPDISRHTDSLHVELFNVFLLPKCQPPL